MKPLSEGDVLQIAELARLALTAEEREQIRQQLAQASAGADLNGDGRAELVVGCGPDGQLFSVDESGMAEQMGQVAGG